MPSAISHRDDEVCRRERQRSRHRVRAGRRQDEADRRHGIQLTAELVLLAMGFVSPVKEGMLEGARRRARRARQRRGRHRGLPTSLPKVSPRGDMRRGQSLVVWAIREGRQCARARSTRR